MNKHTFSIPFTATFIASLMGCASGPIQLAVPFDAKEAKTMLAKGNNQISGKIHFEPDRGHVFAYPNTVVSCEGNEVTLIPYTDYAREWATKYYGKPVTDLAYKLTHRARDQKFIGYDAFMAQTIKTSCDDSGNFAFKNVADGEYFVMAKVEWKGRDEEIYKFAFAPEDIDEEDGTVIKKVSVKGNANLKLDGPWP